MKLGRALLLLGIVGSITAACGDDSDDGSTAGSGGANGDAGNDASGGAVGIGGTPDSGTDGPNPTEGPPTIVERSPDVNDANAWFGAPVRIVFSEPLAEASITNNSFSLETSAGALAANVKLSNDSTTVTLTPSSPPAMPATVTVKVSGEITDRQGDAFAGETWQYEYPLWHRVGSLANPEAKGLQPAVALDKSGNPVVAWRSEATMVRPVRVARWTGSEWQRLGGDLNQSATLPARRPRLVIDDMDRPIVVWEETDGETPGAIYAKRFDGENWVLLGGESVGTSADGRPEVELNESGSPVVAYRNNDTTLSIRALSGGAWMPLGDDLTDGNKVLGFAFSLDEGHPVLAYEDGTHDLSVTKHEGSWTELGDKIPRVHANPAAPALALDSSAVPYLAFTDGDAVSQNVYVYRFDADGSQWERLGAALDVTLDASVGAPTLRVANDDVPYVAWHERYIGAIRVFVAKYTGEGFRTLGTPLNLDPSRSARDPALALSADGMPNVAFAEAGDIVVRRYNSSPELPHGLPPTRDNGDCTIPADDDTDFPQALSETGCYVDLEQRKVVPGAIPFAINSVLWSDGAAKQRYIVLPEGATIDYTPSGALGLPVGTILIKEFLIEAQKGDPNSLIPMETRFLVKRCEEGECPAPWQGYSYEWNAGGTDGTLLPDAPKTKEWSVTNDGEPETHEHSYPSRAQCVNCHNAAIGRTLGIQAAQLNRDLDYGGVVENQLRAWVAAGIFGSSFPKEEPEALFRMPSPNDVGYTLEERSRAYFHANCSHCHNSEPGAVQDSIDFRFQAPLVANNICDKLVAGDPDSSPIYMRDSEREDPLIQMPPLATLIPDERQLPTTYAWILQMPETGSCPPSN